MMLGARIGSWGGWQNPYIHDSLKWFYDGVWNVAGGVHDDSATQWIDLVSGEAGTMQGNIRFSDRGLVSTMDDPSGVDTQDEFPTGHDFTLEGVLVKYAQNTSDTSVFTYIPWASRRLNVWMYKGGSTNLRYRDNITPNLYYTLGEIAFFYARVHGDSGSLWLVQGDAWKKVGVAYTAPSDAVGGAMRCGAVNATQGLEGEYMSLRRHTRFLTDAEIAHNYAIDKARFGLT